MSQNLRIETNRYYITAGGALAFIVARKDDEVQGTIAHKALHTWDERGNPQHDQTGDHRLVRRATAAEVEQARLGPLGGCEA